MNLDGFRHDIALEPERLAALADDLERGDDPLAPLDGLLAARPRRLLLAGMGSSRYAALGATLHLRADGLDATAEIASASALPPAGDDLLVIGITATGGSPETRAALDRYRGRARTAVVTNRPQWLAGVADAVVDLRSGPEDGGIHCRTFQATVALLHLLRARLGGPPCGPADLRRAAAAQAALLDGAHTWLPGLLDHVRDGALDVVGPAERIGSALQGSLMLREAPRIASAPYETGDWPHVGVYLSRHPGYRALLLPGSPYDGEVVRWCAEQRSTLVAIGPPVPGATLHVPYPDADDPLVASLVETSAVELVAAALWERAGGR